MVLHLGVLQEVSEVLGRQTGKVELHNVGSVQ